MLCKHTRWLSFVYFNFLFVLLFVFTDVVVLVKL